MERSGTVNVRIEPNIKAEAEEIFNAIGLSTATAINAFYRQVILRRGLPFNLTTVPAPPNLAHMSQDEIDAALQASMNDYKAGRVLTEEELERRFQDSGRG